MNYPIYPNYPTNVSYIFKSFCITIVLAYFFYRKIIVIIPMSIIGFFFYLKLLNEYNHKYKKQFLHSFRDAILIISSLLKSGYSVENAFMKAIPEIDELTESKKFICELKGIRVGLQNNISIDLLLRELGEKVDIIEIKDFANVFQITKLNGGSLPQIIETYANIIHSKFEVEEEINTILTAKKMELNIMRMVPFIIVTYIEITNKGYFLMFYNDIYGNIIMTIFLLLYLIAYIYGDYILDKAFG